MDQEVLSKDGFSEDYIPAEALEPFEYENLSVGGVMIKRVKTRPEVKDVLVPFGVKKLGEGAFSGCRSLTKVFLPESLVSIGYEVFMECTRLTEITLPRGLVSIGWCAFRKCDSLKTIKVPLSLKQIDDAVFSRCLNLTDIYYEGTKKQWSQIKVGSENVFFTRARIHFNSY